MSSPLRTPITAVLMLGGAATAVVGLVVMASLGFGWGLLIAVVGLIVEIGGAWHHDWVHKRRGEQQHALWGRDNRNRPSWLGGPGA